MINDRDGDRMEYIVKIDAFEGPLDLLLYLIKEMKISIDEVNMTEVTNQYLDYIHQMEELDLVIASEYLVMAAYLVHIKSRHLLPQYEMKPEGTEYEEDPEEQLRERLKLYKKFKDIVPHLYALYEERCQYLAKIPTDLSKEIRIDLKDLLQHKGDVYDLLSAFNRVLRRYQLHRPLKTTIASQTITVEERMKEIEAYLQAHRQTTFEVLYKQCPTREHVVVTFMALLELAKQNVLKVKQDQLFGAIYIHYSKGEEDSHE